MGTALSHFVAANAKQGARIPDAGEFFGHYLPSPEMTDDDLLAQMKAFAGAYNAQFGLDAEGKPLTATPQ